MIMNSKYILLTTTLFALGCSQEISSSANNEALSSDVKVISASVSPTARALIATSGTSTLSGLSSMNVSSQSSIKDNLLQWHADGSISKVTYTIEDTWSGEITEIDIPVSEIKSLSDNYVALKIQYNRTLILNKTTSEIYDLKDVDFRELQVDDNNLYSLTSFGQLYRVDLNDPELTTVFINDVNGTASNTNFGSAIRSRNGYTSPFRIESGTTTMDIKDYDSLPSYIVTKDYVLAVSNSGSNIMLFKEGEPAFDCQMSEIFNVGGGSTGGAILAPNKSLYQIRIVPASIATDRGDRLIKFNLGKNYVSWINTEICWGGPTDTVVSNLGTTTHFTSLGGTNYGNVISATSKYKITDVERFVLDPAGFLRTYTDGNNGVTMNWTALDLSDVPNVTEANNKRLVFLDGNKVFYKKNGNIYYQVLASGTSKALYYSGLQIDNFEITNGKLIFTNSTGAYKVDQAGGTAELVAEGIAINNTLIWSY
jgi:hypothetical protein